MLQTRMSPPHALLPRVNREARVRLQETAQSQLGLITRAQVLECGLSPSAHNRLLAAGELIRVRRNVYRLSGGPPESIHQTLRAVCMALGDETTASHRSAAWLWGLDGFKEPYKHEVTTAHGHRTRISDVVVHQRRGFLPEGYTIRAGVPVTVLTRTLLDLAPLVKPAALEVALDSAGRGNPMFLLELDEFLGTVKPMGREGINALYALVKLRRGNPCTDSGGETEVLQAVRRAGIEDPFLQYPIFKDPDRPLCHADFAWPRLRIALFVDSGYHVGKRARLDATQRLELVKLGWQPIVVMRDMVKGREWIASFAELFHPKFPRL